MRIPAAITLEAQKIVSSARAGSYRPLVAWAIAVLDASHAMYPLLLSRTGMPEALCPGEGGCSMDRGRWRDYNRKGVVIRDGDLPKPLAFSWADIAAVFYARHPCREAIERCQQAMKRRKAHPDPWSGDDWGAIEDECYRAGLAVWQACRPADQGEQLDLFATLES